MLMSLANQPISLTSINTTDNRKSTDVTKTETADMRSLEMPTVSASQQAHHLSEMDEYHLNSDGTTLNQKKVQGMLMNGVVLGIKDVVDGSAKAAIKELGRVLDHIRDVGLQLNLPGADRIGWALIETSMSDQASTQKAFNNLLQQNIDSERKEGSRACTKRRERTTNKMWL